MPFPESREKLGHFAGFVDDVGDSFCFKIVSTDDNQILYRSVLRSALDTANPNFRAKPEHLISDSTNGENTNYSSALPNLLRRDALDPGFLLNSNSNNPNSEIPTNRVHCFNPEREPYYHDYIC